MRLEIVNWPDDAPRGAVSAFCAEHGISRRAFYAIRDRVKEEGSAAAVVPKSRRPHSHPHKLDDELFRQAVLARQSLQNSGWDYGPVSVYNYLTQMGIPSPSAASLARHFRKTGLSKPEPRKKPRSAYRRFVYPQPNSCWQIDATWYTLTHGRKCVIFQVIDDHSRLAIASLVAESENATAAVAVVAKGILAHGVPQRILSDNGVALNPSRRGATGLLQSYAFRWGVEMITGKPYKPTTQGKNERFHQTLFKWLNQQPIADSIDQLQALVDQFDEHYNTRRIHQALTRKMTPQQAYDATVVAAAPEPVDESALHPQLLAELAAMRKPARKEKAATTVIHRDSTGNRIQKVYNSSTTSVNGVLYWIPQAYRGGMVVVHWDPKGIVFTAESGEILCEYDWPPMKTKYMKKQDARWIMPETTPTKQ